MPGLPWLAVEEEIQKLPDVCVKAKVLCEVRRWHQMITPHRKPWTNRWKKWASEGCQQHPESPGHSPPWARAEDRRPCYRTKFTDSHGDERHQKPGGRSCNDHQGRSGSPGARMWVTCSCVTAPLAVALEAPGEENSKWAELSLVIHFGDPKLEHGQRQAP